jgi:AraC-like DNA-binding protein
VGYWSANLTGRGDAERLNGTRVSANLFETLGVNAAVGRALGSEDDRPGAPSVVVMTYGLWQRLDYSAKLLAQFDRSLSTIAFMTGFYDQSHFTHLFKLRFGVTPGDFRAGLKRKQVSVW